MNCLDYNECLEFLGDVVLELMVLWYLFDKYFNLLEGNLIKMCVIIVCEFLFVIFVNKIGLNEMILFGKGEEKIGGCIRLLLILDVFEVFIGVLYLD